MNWSPVIASELERAVPPFRDVPLDWKNVLARSGERGFRRRLRRLLLRLSRR